MLDENTWRFINTFAPWLSASGTIAAVIISLRFARRDKRIRLEVSAGHRLLVTMGAPGPHQDFLCIHIVNVGHRDAQITGVGWKVGIFRKRYAVQTLSNDAHSSQLPIRLKDGEEAKYFVPLNNQTNWLEDFADKMLKPFPILQGQFVVVQAFTSIGDKFETRIEKGLRKMLIEASKRKGSSNNSLKSDAAKPRTLG